MEEEAKPAFEERMDRGLGLRRALSDETQARPFQPMGGEAGAILVHLSAQLEPFLTQIYHKHPLIAPDTSCNFPEQFLHAPPIPSKAIKLS